jgi:hypothetical protein
LFELHVTCAEILSDLNQPWNRIFRIFGEISGIRGFLEVLGILPKMYGIFGLLRMLTDFFAAAGPSINPSGEF